MGVLLNISMCFKLWLLKEDMRDLARAYSDSLRNVPQDAAHHPEGSVLNHVRLVRKSILTAASELQNLKHDALLGYALSDLDFRLGEEDIKVLNLAAWLHDIGKSTATTIDSVRHSDAPSGQGKIQAIGHESPEHYQPMIDRMLGLSPKNLADFYESNRELGKVADLASNINKLRVASGELPNP